MSRHLKPYRGALGHSYAFGVQPTLDILSLRPRQVRKVLLYRPSGGGDGVGRIQALCRKHHTPVETCPRAIRRISGRDFPAVAVFRKFRHPISATASHLVLVHPRFSRNVGAAVRTMLGFGLKDLALIGEALDPLSPGVVRASMGAAFHLRWGCFADFDAYRRCFGLHHVYCFTPEGRCPVMQCRPRRPFALVFGSEGSGLPPRLRSYGTTVRIPHAPTIDSLNLAVTVGIALHTMLGPNPSPS